jgi:hypothetical protein
MSTIKVFDYIEELDAFLVRPEFVALSERLGLTEWTPVVWIGRLFFLDNDYGEHWFDNWDEWEGSKERAAELDIDDYDLMITTPWRFQDGENGPCNTDSLRKAFWTDVLKSLTLSHDLIFEAARQNNVKKAEYYQQFPDQATEDEEAIRDLEERIAEIKTSLV